ncbi:hypothetical protein IMCC12053_2727 [Celeribacter marinus]|uniref:Uncharacterized protein n=1 Tax=Celeribacter marinus TaxID=1397108 RepID=A0A0P0A7D7_9RHOB|nr:hypothetical protein IMCC12053_2727 [Celeribacter marinus]
MVLCGLSVAGLHAPDAKTPPRGEAWGRFNRLGRGKIRGS